MKQILENWRKYTEDTPREVLSEELYARSPKTNHLGLEDYDVFIERASKATGMPFGLIKAIIMAESNFVVDRVSKAGAVGLMQIMPKGYKTDQHMFVNGKPAPKDKWLDPETNIMSGAKHIKYFLKMYKNNLSHALAANNAGTVVTKWIRNGIKIPEEIPWPETKAYVPKILKFYKYFTNKHKATLKKRRADQAALKKQQDADKETQDADKGKLSTLNPGDDVSTQPETSLDEEAKSKSQQRFMGMVHKCKTDGDCASAEVEKTADSMKSKDVKDFAKTKHTGLPNKVKKK